MDKPHLTFWILSRLNLLLSPSDLLIKLFYMSHGHDLSLKVTVLRLFLFLSLDLKRIFILWPFLNFNLWISIVILDFNLYFILYFTVFYHCFVQHFGQCKLNLNVLYKYNLLTYLLNVCINACVHQNGMNF